MAEDITYSENVYPKRKDILGDVTAAQFGRYIAEALLESKSSTAYFFIQQAVEKMGIVDAEYVSWEDANRLLERFVNEEKLTKRRL